MAMRYIWVTLLSFAALAACGDRRDQPTTNISVDATAGLAGKASIREPRNASVNSPYQDSHSSDSVTVNDDESGDQGDDVNASFVTDFGYISDEESKRAVDFVATHQGGLLDGSIADGTDILRVCAAIIPSVRNAFEYMLVQQGGAGFLFFKFHGKLMQSRWQSGADRQVVEIPSRLTQELMIDRINISGLGGPYEKIMPEFKATIATGSNRGTVLSYQVSNPLFCT